MRKIKILNSADWHVNLHKKKDKVPYEWQLNRYIAMFKEFRRLEQEVDVHVIAGDLFDKAPEPDDICLMLSYLNSVSIPTIIIPGNHEASKKGSTFWEYFLLENSITNPNVMIFIKNDRVKIKDYWFCMFPYTSVETKNLPDYYEGDILVTHIRGEVPPFITEEYDFNLLRPWPLVLLGDLHFNHKYKDMNVYYPGSPVNTTFDRDDSKEYGVNIIEYEDSHYTVKPLTLNLPKLIRKTIKAGDKMTPDSFHHVLYEITGSMDELAKVEKSALLDKKIVHKATSSATLDFANKGIIEELAMWLEHTKVANIPGVLATFESLGFKE